MSSDIVLSSASRTTVLSLQRTERQLDVTTLRLATGKKVNSALDNPQNFFASTALSEGASDYQRRLDGIGQNARTIQEALIGVDAISDLIDQGEAVVTEARENLLLGIDDPAVYEEEINTSPPSLSSQILAASPDVYFRLNDGGGIAVDSGTGGGVAATYANGAASGAPALYTNGGTTSATFDGVNDRVRITDSPLINTGNYPARSMELVFNADDVMTRQILFEEGGPTNSLAIYIFNGEIHITGRDSGNWGPTTPGGPTNIRAPINVGETYHVAFVFSQAQNRFEGYLNGASINTAPVPVGNQAFPSHGNNIGIGGMEQDAWFDDILGNGSGFSFNGRISDVAIYNSILDDNVILAHAQSLNSTTSLRYFHRDFENILNQIDGITIDAHYRGTNLLRGETLTTIFNPNVTSLLETEGEDLSVKGLGIQRFDFNDINDLDGILENLRAARTQVRNYATTLISDLNIIRTREIYTREITNTLDSGANDLTIADQNEEGANLLAAQTRQQLGVTALSLASASNQSVLNLF